MLETPSISNQNDTKYYPYQEKWYPVHYIQDLDKTKPTPFTLLGKNIVIWWDRNKQNWQVFIDQCPHRLVPLSEGRINENGHLECPYHGWSFAGDGTCQRIPQKTPDTQPEISSRACAKTLPTIEKQGLLFVYPGNPENAEKTPVPIIEPIEESPQDWVILNTFRDIPYDALTLLENLLDPSHVAFTHHRSMGNRANAGPLELELTELNQDGFYGIWKQGLNARQTGKISTTFIAPSCMWHDINSPKARIITSIYAIPMRKGECRLIARFPFKFNSKIPQFFLKIRPRWYYHLGQNIVLEDDQIFLHYQERHLATKGGSANFNKAFYLATKADTFVSALREWVNKYNAETFPGEPLPPLITNKDILLERYHSHTEKCGSCKQALSTIQKIKLACAIIAIFTLATSPLIAIFIKQNSMVLATLETIIPLLFSAAWWKLNNLEKKFYQGEIIPPRNLD